MDHWQFFRKNPGRNYRCRLATADEIENLAAHGALPPAELIRRGALFTPSCGAAGTAPSRAWRASSVLVLIRRLK
jgi:hypothetical protein